MSQADETETSIALAIDANVHLERARDFVMPKLWHEVSSHKVLAPTTGAVNVNPSRATLEQGEPATQQIAKVPVDKIVAILAENNG